MCSCQDCNALLSDRLLTRINVQSSNVVKQTYDRVKDWSFEQLRDWRTKGDNSLGLSIPVVDSILPFGASASSSAERSEKTKISESDYERVYLATDAEAHSSVSIQTLSPDLKEMYLACLNKKGAQVLVNLELVPQPGQEFVVTAQWVPDPFQEPENSIAITDVEFDQTEIKALDSLTNLSLIQGTAVLLRFKRIGTNETEIILATQSGEPQRIKIPRALQSFKDSIVALVTAVESRAMDDAIFQSVYQIAEQRAKVWPAIRKKKPQPPKEIKINNDTYERLTALNIQYKNKLDSFEEILLLGQAQLGSLVDSSTNPLELQLALSQVRKTVACIGATKAVLAQPNSWAFTTLMDKLASAGLPDKSALNATLDALRTKLG